MKKPLKEAMAQHYEQYSLSENQLKQLEQLQQAAQPKIKKRSSWKAYLSVASAAAIFLFIGVSLWTAFQIPLRQEIAAEIAYNHNKQLNMEIETASLHEAKSYFAKLDFAMVDSHVMTHDQWEMMGGRYCNIQNKLAAQLRLKHKPTNKIYTWYQISNSPKLAKLSGDYETYSNGVKVTLWQEKGVVHGLAAIE